MKQHCLIVLAFLASSALGAPAFADSPRQFLQHALEGDNSEIMLGRVAQDRARSPRVRDFGEMLVRDHSQARDEVLRLGRRMGLRSSRDIAPEARDERDRLSRMNGDEFDREFARYMVDDHRKDISDFQDESRERHGAVSDLARRQLPTLRKHLDMASSLMRDDDHRGFRDRNDHGRDNDHDRQDHDSRNR